MYQKCWLFRRGTKENSFNENLIAGFKICIGFIVMWLCVRKKEHSSVTGTAKLQFLTI